METATLDSMSLDFHYHNKQGIYYEISFNSIKKHKCRVFLE